jgi:ion channel
MLYLALVPTFATFYTLVTAGFYQTSATHEPSYVDTQFAIERAVARATVRAVQVRASTTKVKFSYLYEPNGLNISVTTTEILVTLGFSTEKGGDIAVAIDISPDQLPDSGDAVGGYVQVPYTIRSDESDLGTRPQQLLVFEDYTSSSQPPYLPMGVNEFRSIQEAVTAANGSVEGLPYQWLRMVYFSAVTVTTLGFGDIAPTTMTTRLLVTGEAVLGVVFAGLFLNALAQRAGRRVAATVPDGQEDVS